MVCSGFVHYNYTSNTSKGINSPMPRGDKPAGTKDGGGKAPSANKKIGVAAVAPVAPSNKPITKINGKPSLAVLLERADISPLDNLNSKRVKQRVNNFMLAAIDIHNYPPCDVHQFIKDEHQRRGNRSTDTSRASSMQQQPSQPQSQSQPQPQSQAPPHQQQQPQLPAQEAGSDDDGGNDEPQARNPDVVAGQADASGFEAMRNAITVHTAQVERNIPHYSQKPDAEKKGKGSYADAVGTNGPTKTVKIDPVLAKTLAEIREHHPTIVPPSTAENISVGDATTAARGHTGFMSYDTMSRCLTVQSVIESMSPMIKKAMLRAKTCIIIVRKDIVRSTIIIMSGVPSVQTEKAMSSRRIQIARMRVFGDQPKKVFVGSLELREITMRLVGSKEDINKFAKDAKVRWSENNSFERNGKVQCQCVAGVTREQCEMAGNYNLLYIPDACITADYKYDHMLTFDFKYEVGPEQAHKFLKQFQDEHRAFTSILMFRGRVMMQHPVTADFIEDLKKKHKDVLINVRCPALGSVTANKRRAALAAAAASTNDDDALTVSPAIVQEGQQAINEAPGTCVIATKVEGDASPYITSNQADTLEKELHVVEGGEVTKQVAFNGSQAMYVVPQALLEKLELDEAQESFKTPADHYIHFQLSDGTVLALRPYKTYQQGFTALRQRREASLAANVAEAQENSRA